ncbi:L,D-transpeptidase family protein [Solimonas marina]|uniref:L,D-transpeptidase family protein n=1 Tax=Solimonas marina TaxID=2714601 RepID=A0A969W5Y9_9GAMM|nr:L,D-transpeptidase family protein [Solimonas marina]NKF21042.1 L,D-transpeptidase family protein [Solimonas marina]
MSWFSIARPAALAAGLALLSAAAAPASPEQRFGAIVDLLSDGKTSDALHSLQSLTASDPNFVLGRQLYDELQTRLADAKNDTDGAQLKLLARDARLRLASAQAIPKVGTMPNSVLQLANSFKHLIVVDLPRARLYVFGNHDGKLELLHHYYAAMGKNGWGKQVAGDNRTPVGLYHVTGWIPGKQLPAFYGAGAFPINYPNLWDQFKRRTGYGIWLHGMPTDTETRAPLSSEGCVTLANTDLMALKPYIDPGQTPVLLSDALSWETPTQMKQDREAFMGRLERWRHAWSSLDTQAYLDFYAPDFTTEGMNRAAFVRHKQRVNALKTSISVKLDDISLFRYPGSDGDVLLAEFSQHYRSSNFSQDSHKQQFWKRQADGSWKIFREENR